MTAQIPARCDICMYSRPVRMRPTDIQTVLVCKRLPPTASMVPQKGGAGITSLSPIVSPTDMCYEFQHDAAKVPSTPLGAANDDTPN